jgi:hypothetical protein
MSILEILKKAEKEIREAIAEAARSGDYQAVDVGRSVAINIQELCEKVSGKSQTPQLSTKIVPKIKETKKQKKATRRNKPEGLPKIEIRNGSMYKIGWSKKQKEIYEHKVPRTAFDTIVSAMSTLAKEVKGPFMAEAVIEKISATQENSVPAYQVYVVLAALRDWNIISQIGREGYNIATDVAEKAQNIWKELSNQ